MIDMTKGLLARLALLGMRQEAIEDLLRGESLRMYAGAAPHSANEKLSALQQPLIEMYNNGTGYAGTVCATGTPTFFRWGEEAGDDPLFLQGSVGHFNADINMSVTSFHVGQPIRMSELKFGFGS